MDSAGAADLLHQSQQSGATRPKVVHILTLCCLNKARVRSHKVWPTKTLVIAAFLQQLSVKVSFACILTMEYAGLVTCRAPALNAHKDASGVKV